MPGQGPLGLRSTSRPSHAADADDSHGSAAATGRSASTGQVDGAALPLRDALLTSQPEGRRSEGAQLNGVGRPLAMCPSVHP
jgi:hypothetical protein